MFVQGDKKIARLVDWVGLKPPVKFHFYGVTAAGLGGRALLGGRLIPLRPLLPFLLELRVSSKLTGEESHSGQGRL